MLHLGQFFFVFLCFVFITTDGIALFTLEGTTWGGILSTHSSLRVWTFPSSVWMCSFSIGQGKSLYPRDQFCPSVICTMCILYFYNQCLWFMCGAVLWMTHAELFQAFRNYLREVYLCSVIFTRTCRPVKSLLNHEYLLRRSRWPFTYLLCWA